MRWTDRRVTLGLILTLSLGLCTLFFVTAAFALTAVFEFLGLFTIILGWFVLAPAYYLYTRPTADGDRLTDDRLADDNRSAAGADRNERANDPLDVLQRRYAAGGLSESEFERKVDRLLETDARAARKEKREGKGDVADELDRELEFE